MDGHRSVLPQVTADMRRLRFDFDMKVGESIPGALARAASGHHLGSVHILLKEAGLPRGRSGLTQFLPTEQIHRLAHLIRTDPAMLAAGAGRRTIPAEANVIQQHVAFGDLVIPRAYIDVLKRRISPLSLVQDEMHRADWLNVLLPYCPVSLERLVDACGHCDSSLGWNRTLGIGACEDCGRRVDPSSEPALPEDMAEDYRLFAGLVSINPDARAAAHELLPIGLSRLSPGELVRLAVRCGLDCRTGAGPRAWQKRLGQLPAMEVAAIVARGASLVRTWPEGIRAWAMGAAADSGTDAKRYADVRRRLRRVARGDGVFRSLDEVMNEAFPNYNGSIAHSFADGSRYYLGNEVDRLLGIPHHRVVALRDRNLLPFTKVPGGPKRTRGRYCATTIDELGRRIRSSVDITACQPALGLPIYAVEQLLCMDLLQAEVDPVVIAAFDGVRVKRASIDLLIARLTSMASKVRKPRGLTPLVVEMRRFGGRPKPWAAVYSAMLSDDVQFWAAGGTTSLKLMVIPGSIDALGENDFLESDHPSFPFSTEVHTADAAEILNFKTPGVDALRVAGVIPSIRRAKSFRSPKDEIYALAAEYVSTAELMRRGRTSAERVNVQLSARGFTRRHGLWVRSEVMGVIPIR